MSSQDFLQVRALAAEQKFIHFADNGPVVFRLKEKAGSTGTPTVVISGTQAVLTLTDSAGTATAIDLTAAAYNTVGEVADYINGLGTWTCKVLDALRSDSVNNKLVTDSSVSASVAEGETVFDVTSDTGRLTAYRMRITYDRSASSTKPKGSHRVTLKTITYYLDHTAAAGVCKLYEVTNGGKTETLVYSSPLTVDNTATTLDFGDGITPGEGNDFVIAFDGTVVDAAANYLEAQYKRE